MSYDVVIVGSGPNGLLMAGELALAGVDAVVLERLPEPSTRPKANGLVGRVVEALDRRGVYELFSGHDGPPRPVPHFPFGAIPLDLTPLPGHSLYALPIQQRRMEQLLADRAAALGVRIRRGHEVTAISQTADLVTVDVLGTEGHYRLDTRYLVAADGGTSAIRKQLGIGFPGITDDGFVSRVGRVGIAAPVAASETGELDVPGIGRLTPASFTRTETGLFAYGMFEPGIYRVSAFEWGETGVEDSDDIPLDELAAALHRVLGTELPLIPPPGGGQHDLRRRVGVNSRQAESYRAGRVFLVGDAAHVHSAVGGPGLNLGMQDVLNLGWKLAAAVHGWAPAGLLDTYESERRPAGERVIMHTRAQTALLSPGPNTTALRSLLTELLDDTTATRRVADLMAGADVRYPARFEGPAHPLTGRWAEDLPLRVDGRETRVAELLRAARPVLLDLTGRAELIGAACGWTDRVGVVTATTPEPPADVLLVRPDGYVAWAGEHHVAGLRQALHAWFGAPAISSAGVA
ncbi:FAD-dependent monooxygenase [Pseudonocardia sp. DSM 110487]|uniref:FAD-dependent monooxygenase n=1 Tax=Pseudonocardia sp. DSM 110487 TaxID=2865833 RepID=UPI001C697410|nr:FAD-dependent monooxygenase [Pseudonocardia sp. DSM 110487]QYN32670.1 FAD-dependent monooxygenase [Pseudonocardia sp. DSM 110487]